MLAVKIAARTGTSSGRKGRKPGFGSACAIVFTTSHRVSAPAPRQRRAARFSARCNRTSAAETVCRAASSRDLPRRAFLGVLDRNAHRGKQIADTIGLRKVLTPTRRRPLREQALDFLGIDAARLLLAPFPLRGTLREKAEQPQRTREGTNVAAAQAMQRRDRQRCIEVVEQRLDHCGGRLAGAG